MAVHIDMLSYVRGHDWPIPCVITRGIEKGP